jgi:hypothetical protein
VADLRELVGGGLCRQRELPGKLADKKVPEGLVGGLEKALEQVDEDVEIPLQIFRERETLRRGRRRQALLQGDCFEEALRDLATATPESRCDPAAVR